jgi:hypothetical protein
LSSESVSWCAGFLNWCLSQSWYDWTWSYVARSFIGQGATWWHVWIKIWWMILWWNQSNEVCFTNIKIYPKIRWWLMPEDIWIEWKVQNVPKNEKWELDISKISDWAIICS